MRHAHVAAAANGERKVVEIQALRALAALAVAAVHLTWGFAAHIDTRLHGLPAGRQLAQAAVALFFIISGCVMVLSSDRLFGSRRASLTFWRRRAVRVIPPYWVASVLLAAILLGLGRAVDGRYLAQSMLFVPKPAGAGEAFRLFLWPGWTLLYELFFYALFGAAIGLGRAGAVAATSLVLIVLVIVGTVIPESDLALFIVSRPIVLLFAAGMLFGLALERGFRLPAWIRWVALLAGLLAFLVPKLGDDPLGFAYLLWAGLPAILVFLAAVSGPSRLPLAAPFGALGDASYAIYLIHVPFAHLWMRVFSSLGHPGGSIGFIGLGVPLLIVLSLLYYRAIERPMTGALNRLAGGKGSREGGLDRTLAP